MYVTSIRDIKADLESFEKLEGCGHEKLDAATYFTEIVIL